MARRRRRVAVAVWSRSGDGERTTKCLHRAPSTAMSQTEELLRRELHFMDGPVTDASCRIVASAMEFFLIKLLELRLCLRLEQEGPSQRSRATSMDTMLAPMGELPSPYAGKPTMISVDLLLESMH
ncbi:hypothetical protein EJB05_09837, partial [Eragrostis curvula]